MAAVQCLWAALLKSDKQQINVIRKLTQGIRRAALFGGL
jgi:hypothetical protein